jgi:hypothetical protein
LTGVAVKVTEVPAQTDVAEAAAVTATGRSGLTVIVIVFEETGFPVVHNSLDVSTQDTVLP